MAQLERPQPRARWTRTTIPAFKVQSLAIERREKFVSNLNVHTADIESKRNMGLLR